MLIQFVLINVMYLGEPKNTDITLNFDIPSNLSSDYILSVYIDIRENVMLIRREIFNYLENI